MTPLRSQYPLALLCRVLKVSRSGGLCLAARASVDTHPGACAAGSGHSGSTRADPTHVRSGASPSGIAGRRVSGWSRAHHAPAQEVRPTLPTSAAVYDDHRVHPCPASGGECLGAHMCRHTPPRNLGDRYYVCTDCRRLAASRRHQGSLHLRGGRSCDGRPDDDRLGIESTQEARAFQYCAHD